MSELVQTPPHRVFITPDSDDDGYSGFDLEASPERKLARHAIRHAFNSSIASSVQEDKAALADPNKGRCLLTGQSVAVERCHLVPQGSPDALLSSLEWAWGKPHKTLNVDTHYNIVFLRADLHRLLDSDDWMLLPEQHYVNTLYQRIGSSTSQPGKIEEVYGTTKEFKYYIIPFKEMEEILISRVIPQQDLSPVPYKFVHHQYPYASLGPLLSHVQPHFAIYNAEEKRQKRTSLQSSLIVANVRACLDLPTTDLAIVYLFKLSEIYKEWIVPPPASFSAMSHSPPGFLGGVPGNPGDCHSEGSRRSNPSYAARTTGGGSGHGPQSQYSGHHIPDLQHTRSSSEQDTMDGHSFASDDGEATLAEITWNKKYVSRWLNQVTKVVTREGEWELGLLNDPQLGSYAEESCRSPFLEWHPTWMRRGWPDIQRPPPDTSKFSSNDWSLRNCFIRLPDPVDLD